MKRDVYVELRAVLGFPVQQDGSSGNRSSTYSKEEIDLTA